MTSKYIDTAAYATSGYLVSGNVTSFTIGPAGVIGGEGFFNGGKTTHTYTIVNRGLISGTSQGDGAIHLGSAIIMNTNTISGNGTTGVYLLKGSVTNTGTGAITSTLDAVRTTGNVVNGGAITGGLDGIYDGQNGSVTNNAGAVISGGSVGIAFDLADRLTNGGRVVATGAKGVGIYIFQSASLRNNAGALIEAYVGIFDKHADSTVINSGTIESTSTASGSFGVEYVMTLNNAAKAQITGAYGVGVTTLTNAGTIDGKDFVGVVGEGVASIHNNGTAALIEGAVAGIEGQYATFANSGTIVGFGATSAGAENAYVLSNAKGALIEGVAYGVATSSARYDSSITNTGTIAATGASGVGISTHSRGEIINQVGGVIKGHIGVINTGIENFGTIESTAGASGIAIELGDDLLIDEPKSVIIGKVDGTGGVLELAGKGGTVTGLGTVLYGFRSIYEVAGAAWTVTGTDVLANAAGSLTVDGLLTATGAATIGGTVSGTGTLALAGTETLAAGAVMSVTHLAETGGSITLAKNLTYNGSFTQSAGPIKVTGYTLVLNGADKLTNGAISGAGFLATYGAVSLVNYTINGGAVWQVCGTATATASITLGNGGGGSGRLAVETRGVYDITANGGIVVAPGGSGTVGNFALFEKTGGAGISTIAAAFTNSGTLNVTSGALDLAAAVTGTGSATIGSAGVLRFDSTVAATQTIAFAGTTGGRLALNDPSGTGLGFAGIVKGFGGKDQLDLTTFAFSGKPAIGWSQTSASSGTLTVTDGSKIARITLFGQYSQAGFGKSQDGGSGTDITYTTPPQVVAITPPHH